MIYPIILQRLQPTIGFAWAVRIVGFLTLACLIIATLTIRTQHPTRKAVVPLSSLVDLHGFRDLRYTLATLSAFLYVDSQLGLYLCDSTKLLALFL